MKSIADLKKLRDEARSSIDLRDTDKEYRIVVGMATCGIAAGARPVLAALVEGLASKQIKNASVTQTGCIGMCTLEPIVEITNSKNEKTTYVKMTAEKAAEVLASHIEKGVVLTDYTVGNYKQ